MKKGLFLSMALILTMFLTLILFPGNKTEAFYGGFGTYSGLYGGFGTYSGLYGGFGTYGSLYGGFGAYGGLYGGLAGFNPVSIPEGIIYTPSRVSSEILPPESSFTQNTQWPGPLNNFPSFMSSFGTVPVTYSVYPIAPEWPWSDFPAIYSSTLIFPWTPPFLSNPYWPNVYPTVPYPTPLGSIQITK